VGAVAAPRRLCLVEGGAQPDRHEGVLQRSPRRVVGVDVAGCHARNPEPPRELRQQPVAAAVMAPEGALELYPEAVAPE
jgi:hypothetical protein